MPAIKDPLDYQLSVAGVLPLPLDAIPESLSILVTVSEHSLVILGKPFGIYSGPVLHSYIQKAFTSWVYLASRINFVWSIPRMGPNHACFIHSSKRQEYWSHTICRLSPTTIVHVLRCDINTIDRRPISIANTVLLLHCHCPAPIAPLVPLQLIN
jgi:hypothetical protein